MRHGHEEVVLHLKVGKILEEKGNDGVRGAVSSHPTQCAGVVSVNVDVCQVSWRAGDEGGDERQCDDGCKGFPDVDVGVS